MNICKILFVMLISAIIPCSYNLNAEKLKILNTFTNEYPIMTSQFKVYDDSGNELRNLTLTKDDVIVKEKSTKGEILTRKVISDPVLPPVNETSFSLILTLDISTSMDDQIDGNGTIKIIDALKFACKELIKTFSPIRTEIAITTFCGDAYGKNIEQIEPFRPYTSDRSLLEQTIDSLKYLCAGTNYNAAFLHANGNPNMDQFSALYYCKNTVAKYKPIIIFITDGAHLPNWGGEFDIAKVQQLAAERNASIYTIQLGSEEIGQNNNDYLELLALTGKSETDLTPNYWSKVSDQNTLKDIILQILMEAGTLGDPAPYSFNWLTDCDYGNSAEISIQGINNIKDTTYYTIDSNSIPKLEISPKTIYFNDVTPAKNKSLTVKLTARKENVTLTSSEQIFSNSAGELIEVTKWSDYYGNPVTLPFELLKDRSITIEITYSAKDSLFYQSILGFNSSACSSDDLTIFAEMLPYVESINMGQITIGTSTSKTFSSVFCNKTGKKFHVNSIKINGVDKADFEIISPKGSFDLDSGACVEMVFSFSPTIDPPRLESANIIVETDYNGNNKFTGNINGTGLMLPEVQNLYMGEVIIDSTVSKTFNNVFCNSTGTIIKINTINLEGFDAADFEIISPKGSFDLDTGDCFDMELEFTPLVDDPPRLESVTLVIDTDFNGGKKFTGILNGRGILKPISVNENINFHNQININIYPNPANENFRIQIPDYQITGIPGKIKLSLTDNMGRELKNYSVNDLSEINNLIIDVENYSSGLYFIKIYNSNFSMIKTLSIIK